MTGPLAGLTLVVTRPAHQSGPFIALAERAGARCLAVPGIEIERLALDSATRSAADPDAHDWAIFTSTNAVESALEQLPRPQRCRVAAVGRATARALQAAGIRVDAVPDGRSDSEGLLALPGFASVASRRILILRGAGGRELLRDELTRRGADVRVVELYRRRPGSAEPATLDALRALLRERAGTVVVAVTSVEVLDGLLGQLPAELVEPLAATTALLPGDRVAAAARARHWSGAIVVSPAAEDAPMLAALERHVAARRAPPPA